MTWSSQFLVRHQVVENTSEIQADFFSGLVPPHPHQQPPEAYFQEDNPQSVVVVLRPEALRLPQVVRVVVVATELGVQWALGVGRGVGGPTVRVSQEVEVLRIPCRAYVGCVYAPLQPPVCVEPQRA